jgi:antirestriction protein ArdC
MSIRRKVIASDRTDSPPAANALQSGVKAVARALSFSDLEGARCEQASSHRTQYPLLHELCHALVGEGGEGGEGGELSGFSYGLEEVVVESATFVACAAVGLATDVESVPYIAGWAGREEPAKVVREAAEAIDTLARLIEDAIAPKQEALAA